MKEFDIPKRVKDKWIIEFITLFKKFYLDKKTLNPTELIDFKEIVTVLEMSELYIMTKPVIEDIYKSSKMVINKLIDKGKNY